MIDSVQELGKLVKLHRDLVGLTQGQLADRAETNRSAVAHLEQGLRLPAPEVTARMCEALAIPSALWAGFVPRSAEAPIAVRCRCLTDVGPRGDEGGERDRSDKSDKDKHRLLAAVQGNARWVGRKGPADPYAACARRLRRDFPRLFFNRTFVPIPKPARGRDDAGTNLLLSEALAREGVACRVAALLRGGGSAPARADGGPSVIERLADFELRVDGHLPPGIVLVDDLVDRGTTLIACAALLAELGWRGEVDALALACTRGRDHAPGERRELLLTWDLEARLPALRPAAA